MKLSDLNQDVIRESLWGSDKSRLIKSGFFPMTSCARIYCPSCGLICQYMKITDDPCYAHKQLSPVCPFVLQHLQDVTTPIPEKLTYPVLDDIVAFPQYSTLDMRLNSFDVKLPLRKELAICGYFQDGHSTSLARCFNCGVIASLKDTNPCSILHINSNPKCEYMLQILGYPLYDMISSELSNERVTGQLARDVKKVYINLSETIKTIFPARIIQVCIARMLKWKKDISFKEEDDLYMASYIYQVEIANKDSSVDMRKYPDEFSSLPMMVWNHQE